MSLASVLSALAIRDSFSAGVPLFLAVVAGFLAAVFGAGAVGFINGAIIAKLKVPAFIVTLGSSFIVRGLSLLWSENTTVIGLPAGIRAYGNDSLFYLIRGEGGGFYVFDRRVFGYLTPDCVLEEAPMQQLADDKLLMAYPHPGTFYCMDTYRDYLSLNKLWNEGQARWKLWND
jgi:hypothetical protein